MTLSFEEKQILITVKAYPNPSKKYVETVCTVGVDLKENKLIRLYPIPFRDLEINKKFKKYDIIKASVTKAKDDTRPESFKVDCESINVISHLGTKQGWNDRKKHILPLVDKSMCEIERKCDAQDISLGIFKPRRNIEISWESVSQTWKPGVQERYDQLTIFNPRKEVLDKIPYLFRYKYYCQNEPDCRGHNQCIVDWEIGEAYRSWKQKYKEEEKTLEMIKNKWGKELFAEDRDTYLFVGNQHQYKTFMVIGIFWPPRA